MNQLRAQLIQEVVQMGETEDWSEIPEEERPRCATCGKPLSARGEQTRFIQTNGGEAVKLTRTYGTCPQCGVGFFPLDEELGLVSGGNRLSGKTRKGSPWLRSALVEAAHAAIHAKNSYLSAQYQRLVVRRGGKKATIAVGHTLLVIIYHLLSEDKDYQELGGNYFDEWDRQAVQKRLVHRLEKLGYQVKLEPTSPAI